MPEDLVGPLRGETSMADSKLGPWSELSSDLSDVSKTMYPPVKKTYLPDKENKSIFATQ